MNPVIQFIRDTEAMLKLPDLTIKRKLELINTIVQMKMTYDSQLFHAELYKDCKGTFVMYLDAVDERTYEYDQVSKEYLSGIINNFKNEEKLSLINFLIRKLKLKGFEEHISFFHQEKRSTEISIFARKLPRNFFSLLARLIMYNTYSIIMTVVIAILLYFIILLPSANGTVLFEMSYKNYSDVFWENHLYNVLLSLLGLQSDFVKPVNGWGAFLAFTGKLIYIVIVVNICIAKINELINSKF
jgi:hypothetical protein